METKDKIQDKTSKVIEALMKRKQMVILKLKASLATGRRNLIPELSQEMAAIEVELSEASRNHINN